MPTSKTNHTITQSYPRAQINQSVGDTGALHIARAVHAGARVTWWDCSRTNCGRRTCRATLEHSLYCAVPAPGICLAASLPVSVDVLVCRRGRVHMLGCRREATAACRPSRSSAPHGWATRATTPSLRRPAAGGVSSCPNYLPIRMKDKQTQSNQERDPIQKPKMHKSVPWPSAPQAAEHRYRSE
jgi:hypothetical protein